MSLYGLDEIDHMDPHSALDSYLGEGSQITISERLHAVSHAPADDILELRQAQRPELYEALFAHVVPPIHTPHHESQRDSPRERHNNGCGQTSAEAPREPSIVRDVASPASSSPPSLDSREPSLTDGSFCTDEIIRSSARQAILQTIDGEPLPLRMVPESQHGDSQYLVQLAPTVMSSSDESASEDAKEEGAGRKLRCAFWFLGCRKGYRNQERWLTHCNLHLRNCKDEHPVRCQICDKEFGGWNRWLLHIADHQREGVNLKKYRPDQKILPRLWGAKAIKDSEWLEIIGNGRLDAGYKNFLHMHNPAKERRQLAAREWRARAGAGHGH
ncbi:hypothetical protein K461DRAFT_124499 [Myriangium duriaei CBS 260.36]|uniref:C2H2-type domain-containing protein n=1 Tax=Myriangium duriaei CBS 260.36 TaxID=1168546 RepID=A0A9P4J2D8_9PEZI|nr:hypothetical protein K461DRAFT_124499 [Myriangium duriaei CBS 260.36]